MSKRLLKTVGLVALVMAVSHFTPQASQAMRRATYLDLEQERFTCLRTMVGVSSVRELESDELDAFVNEPGFCIDAEEIPDGGDGWAATNPTNPGLVVDWMERARGKPNKIKDFNVWKRDFDVWKRFALHVCNKQPELHDAKFMPIEMNIEFGMLVLPIRSTCHACEQMEDDKPIIIISSKQARKAEEQKAREDQMAKLKAERDAAELKAREAQAEMEKLSAKLKAFEEEAERARLLAAEQKAHEEEAARVKLTWR